jgi:hypothetical protein
MMFANGVWERHRVKSSYALGSVATRRFPFNGGNVAALYGQCLFGIGDNEFACIRKDVRPVQLNIVPADSHVGEIERLIRTSKERLRSCVHGLPFKRLPKLLLTHMVSDTVRCLNLFPWTNAISHTLSPVSIFTGAAHLILTTCALNLVLMLKF